MNYLRKKNIVQIPIDLCFGTHSDVILTLFSFKRNHKPKTFNRTVVRSHDGMTELPIFPPFFNQSQQSFAIPNAELYMLKLVKRLIRTKNNEMEEL